MPQEDGIKKAADAVAQSKKVLESANRFEKEAGGPINKPTVVKPPQDKPAAMPKKSPSSGLLGEAESAAKGIKAKGEAIAEYEKSLQSMKDGGKVEKDGAVKLHKGETVLPKDEKKAVKVLKSKASGVMSKALDEEAEEKAENESLAEEKKEGKKGEAKEEKEEGESKKEEKSEKKLGKHKFYRTEVIHHKNGSHTVTHHPHPPKASADGKMPEAAEPVSYAAPDIAAMHAGMDEHLGGGPEGAE